jgi:5-methylcytosine-specific restriction endonuclease McrA
MIRNRDGRKCLVCGIGENGLRHDVHHIDYDKRNIVPENLVTLCHSCHMKTIYNREPWKAFFLARRINKCLQKN